MKKALLITYFFPPSASTGAIRPMKFVKYLPQLGWQPVVLTCKKPFDFGVSKNPELLKEIPEGVKVFRTFTFEPLNLYWRWKRRKRGLLSGSQATSNNQNQPKRKRLQVNVNHVGSKSH